MLARRLLAEHDLGTGQQAHSHIRLSNGVLVWAKLVVTGSSPKLAGRDLTLRRLWSHMETLHLHSSFLGLEELMNEGTRSSPGGCDNKKPTFRWVQDTVPPRLSAVGVISLLADPGDSMPFSYATKFRRTVNS
jgi:hypothetical protein